MGKTWTAGKPKEQEEMTVTKLLAWIEDKICEEYCKYPEIAQGEVDDPDLAEDRLYLEYCTKCPLSRL